jgi:hypothetical protein
MAREDFEGIAAHAKEVHARRVADNPRRVRFAIDLFDEHCIRYELKNETTGHFHCWRKKDGKLFQFYAGTGKIQGEPNKRGIRALIKILTEKER